MLYLKTRDTQTRNRERRPMKETILGKPPAGHTQKRLQYTVEILWYFEVYKHIEEYSGILDLLMEILLQK